MKKIATFKVEKDEGKENEESASRYIFFGDLIKLEEKLFKRCQKR